MLQGAKGLEKGKGQLAKQQEKRKRAEDKASAPKKCACSGASTKLWTPHSHHLSQQSAGPLRSTDPTSLPKCDCRSKKGQSATLDDWLGSGQGGAASEPRDMPPLLLPRVPLPPLMLPSGDAGAVRPAKKRKGITAADRDVEAVMLRMLKQVRPTCSVFRK